MNKWRQHSATTAVRLCGSAQNLGRWSSIRCCSDPIIIDVLWRIVAEKQDAASRSLFNDVRHPLGRRNQQVLLRRRNARFIAGNRLVAIEIQTVFQFARDAADSDGE